MATTLSGWLPHHVPSAWFTSCRVGSWFWTSGSFQLLKQLHTHWAPKSVIFIAKVCDWVLKSVIVCAIFCHNHCFAHLLSIGCQSLYGHQNLLPGVKVCCLLPFSPPQCLWIDSFTDRSHIGHQSLSPVVTIAQYQSQMSLT